MKNETHNAICHDCRVELGYKPKDDGFHTSQLKRCWNCDAVKSILPSRHWVKEVSNND